MSHTDLDAGLGLLPVVPWTGVGAGPAESTLPGLAGPRREMCLRRNRVSRRTTNYGFPATNIRVGAEPCHNLAGSVAQHWICGVDQSGEGVGLEAHVGVRSPEPVGVSVVEEVRDASCSATSP